MNRGAGVKRVVHLCDLKVMKKTPMEKIWKHLSLMSRSSPKPSKMSHPLAAFPFRPPKVQVHPGMQRPATERWKQQQHRDHRPQGVDEEEGRGVEFRPRVPRGPLGLALDQRSQTRPGGKAETSAGRKNQAQVGFFDSACWQGTASSGQHLSSGFKNKLVRFQH